MLFTVIALASSLIIAPFAEVDSEPLPQKLYRYTFVPHIYLFLTGVMLQRLQVYRSRWIAGKALYWLVGYFAVVSLVPYSQLVAVFEMLLLALVAMSAAYTLPDLSRRLLRGHDISYGVYIYHGLLLNVLVEFGLIGRGIYILAVTCGAYVAGFVSWIGVERRFLHAKKQTNAPEYVAARR
jgi:peptidoglycan/LPS O-acetylase OafA/YrhL